MSFDQQTQTVFAQVAAACQEAGRPATSVEVIAVTKYVDIVTTQELINAGVRHLGENRVDKFLDKKANCQGQDLVWHLIGSLQRRKVKDVINEVDYFHALDSLSLAQEIQKRALKPIKCFLQVNVSGEVSKHGFAPEDLDQVVESLRDLDKIELVGLMTMAPFEASQEELTAIFDQTRQLRDHLKEKQIKNMPLTELSMGMSGDFIPAIHQGASFVRIGSLFFE